MNYDIIIIGAVCSEQPLPISWQNAKPVRYCF